MIALLVLANLLARSGGRAPGAHRDVMTTQGVVRGYLTPQPPHYAFLGVPYARPPTNHDRFKAPKPLSRWDGIFEASHRVKCPQPDGEGSENCLVINIFAPDVAESLPVFVVIHDGAFQYGWGNHQPPVGLLRQNFLVVTFNYRVGVLGFLCMNRAAPGNAGLKDQVAALYWIHKNIDKFGGSPLDVTVHGVGSGAVSLHLILLSGLAKGLLHKAILESSSALSPLALTYNSMTDAIEAAEHLGYIVEQNNFPKLVKFYRTASRMQLANTNKMFLPCIEYFTDGMIDKDPLYILKSNVFQKVPMMFVYTDTQITEVDTKTMAYEPENFEHQLPPNLEFGNNNIKHKVGEVVKDFYFKQGKREDGFIQNHVDYLHDVTVVYPVIKAAFLQAISSPLPVYLMKFTHTTDLKIDLRNLRNDGSIMNFFYENQWNDSNSQVIAKRLVALWSNFVKIGDPTPLTSSLIPVIWQPIRKGTTDRLNSKLVNGLEFDSTLHMSRALVTQQVILWDSIYDKFYRKHKQTEKVV